MNKRYCSVNNWLIDIPSGSILHLTTGEKKRLGEYQLKLLDILMQDAGKIFTREELTNLVWERRVIGNNSLPNAIHALRTALEDDGKQQKIIKTIPKKGYLLEPEYCRVIEKEESEVNESTQDPAERETEEENKPAVPEDRVNESAVMPPAPETPAQEATVPVAAAALPRANRTTFVLFVVLVIVCTTLLTWWVVKRQESGNLTAKEVQPNVYSNIHIYAIEPSGDLSYGAENLYSKLKASLYTLNQQIKTQSVTMTVYFSTRNFMLNYTFALSSPCDKQQLVMAVYQWRLDANQLNNLILRETRRKLNEMAICTEN